jgi:hypothetical protein
MAGMYTAVYTLDLVGRYFRVATAVLVCAHTLEYTFAHYPVLNFYCLRRQPPIKNLDCELDCELRLCKKAIYQLCTWLVRNKQKFIIYLQTLQVGANQSRS